MEKTKIDWCDSTWNPITGCLNNCVYCYAKKIATRFSSHGELWTEELIHIQKEPFYSEENKRGPYPYGFEPTFHKYKISEYKEKSGRNIFVCSMSDLFGEWVPKEWIEEIFEACRNAPQHNYIFLTKNYERAIKEFKFEPNWWVGRTITSNETLLLKSENEICTKVNQETNKFMSIEPLLSDIDKLPKYIHENKYKWIIVGAETGNRKGKTLPLREWIERIVYNCHKENIPVFMKGSLKEIWGETLIQEYPKELKS